MAAIGKPKITLKKSDLNQAILKKNKSLDARNKILDTNIKDKENDIKSLDKEIKSLNNEIKSLIETVSNNKTLLSKENVKLHNMSKDIDDRNSIALTLKNEESSIIKDVASLECKIVKLHKDVSYLETKKKKVDNLIQDVDCLQKQKQLQESEINEIKGKYRSIKEDISNQELFFKNTSIAHKEKINEMSSEFEELSKKIESIKKELTSEEFEYKRTCSKFDEEKNNKSLELKTIESLVNKKEDEYIMWERKLEKLQASCDSENERIAKIKKNFENWKVSSLEGVARMKLKNKMEKIDKAGLKEVLNG